MNRLRWIKTSAAVTAGALFSFLCLPITPAVAQMSGSDMKMGAGQSEEGPTSVTGEVVDLMCYLDHGAKGEKHASCARKCITSGGPVGLLTKDGDLYLIIGDHKPMNDQLADLAAKTVTVRGKVVSRNGMKMIENAEIAEGSANS